MSLAERYGAVAFDLDGVIYHGAEPIAAAPPTLARLREYPVRLLFLTNNSARTPGRVADKLAGIGVQARAEEVLTSAQATAAMLREEGSVGSSAFVVGERGIREALGSEGIRVVDGDAESCDMVIVGWDRSLDYEKLRRATILVQRGARLVATNADASYPGPDGLWPGAGAILAAVTTATGATPTVVGKPGRPMFDAAAALLGAKEPHAPLMVGDRLDTDIAGAAEAGWDSLLVWTGVSKPPDLLVAQHLPTYLAADVSAVLRDMPAVRFRPAERKDGPAIAALLETAGLGVDGIDARVESTIVGDGPEGAAATACLERLGESGILRSVAVASHLRGRGLGSLAVAKAVRMGRERGIRHVSLFTGTARAFFARLGFEPVDRRSLPEDVRESAHARQECANASLAMARDLPG